MYIIRIIAYKCQALFFYNAILRLKKAVKMRKIDKLIMRINNGNIRGGQTKLAQLINVSQPTIARWLNGAIDPTAENIKKMAQVFNCEEKEVKDALQEVAQFETNVKAVPLTLTNTIQLPILADVPAGLPEYSDRDVEMFVDIPRFMFPKADYVVRCIGDSLEPKIHRGDFCVIRTMTDPLDGKAMLVRTESGICMKVIKKMADGLVKLCSTNPAYKPFTPKSLEILGQIIGHWSRDDRESF